MKVVILSLLILVAMGQTIKLADRKIYTTSTTSPDKKNTLKNISSQFVSISLDYLNEIDYYLLQQINIFYPQIAEYKLTDIQERSSPDGQKTQIAFTYDLFAKNITYNSSQILNETIVLVLATDNMTYFVFYNGVTINYSNYTQYRSINHNSQTPIVGQKQSIDITKLNEEQIDNQNFLLEKVPKLKTSKLVSLTLQIVAGSKYCFNYSNRQKNSTQQYCVWSQPWRNFKEITLPDGSIITSDPFPQIFVNISSVENASRSSTNPTSIDTIVSQPAIDNTQTIRPLIVGGRTQSDIKNLNQQQVKAKKFILDNVGKLSTWELVSLESQVVSGMKYYFTFKDPITKQIEMYSIWSQSWNDNFMELTLPDSSKINNRKVPISVIGKIVELPVPLDKPKPNL